MVNMVFNNGVPSLMFEVIPDEIKPVSVMPDSCVDPDYFVEVMEEHWIKELGNVSSDALRACWKQLAETFNNHIEGQADDRWDVLPFPTGSGKTEGTIVYCALLHGVNVLIVTKLKKDCNKIAERINHYRVKYLSSGAFDTDYARAFHGDIKDIKREDLSKYPVLVITHKAFENALENDGEKKDAFITLNPFVKRDLIIIDEALDVINTTQVTLNNLRRAAGHIEEKTRKKYPSEMGFITDVTESLEQQNDNENGNKELMFDDLEALLGGDLKYDLKSLKLDLLCQEVDSQKKGKETFMHHIKKLDDFLRQWVFLSSNYSMNTAKLIIPVDMESAVILDATAETNTMYEAIDKCRVIPPANTHSRNYSNFTLHVSIRHSTGKQFMVENKKEVIDALICESIVDDNTLVITHKDVEPELKKRGVKYVGHYGAVQGSNEWKDLERIVVFGLPFLPDAHYANIFNASQGKQSQEWFDDSKNRGFKNHKDIRKAIKQGQLSSDVIQAINRISVRKTIDSQGNCPVSEGFILLPDNDYGRAIIDNIKSAMPGIKIVNWDYDFQATKKKRSKHEHVLIDYISKMSVGQEVSKKQVLKDTKMSESTLKRLLNKVEKGDGLVSKVFISHNVIVDIRQEGKIKHTYLVKVERVSFLSATAA